MRGPSGWENEVLRKRDNTGRRPAPRPQIAILTCAALFALMAGATLGQTPGETGAGAVSGVGACAKVASPRGLDRLQGTPRHPYRTVRKLLRNLGPGQTGCLRQGTYRGMVRIHRRGRRGQPIVLRGYPGETARIVGRLVVYRRSRHIVVQNLTLVGRNRRGLPSPTINGDHIRFERNEITNLHTGICFALGHPSFGLAERVTLRGNRIHNCGRLPATNHDHGVYVSYARHARIVANWIHNNADRGVQLYPDAQRTYVAGNVINANGQGLIFSGAGGTASSGNLVEGNVISNSRLRHNVESFFPPGAPQGRNNLLRRNCIGGGPRDGGRGGIAEPPAGFGVRGNVIGRPAFRGLGDLRLDPSPCRQVLLTDPERVPGP